MKKAIKKFLVFLRDLLEKVKIRGSKNSEVKKYRDARRVAIYSKVTLTDEQKRAIDKFYVDNYGEKIPYTWHRHFTAFTGRFDERYFPELMFIPEFERYMTLHREYAKVFTDKNMLPMLANSAGVKTPKSFLTAVKGIYRDEDKHFLSKEQMLEKMKNLGEVFVKPTVDTSSGRGCFIAEFENGIDRIGGKTSLEILDSMGADFAIQKRLKCHESIARLYPGSVNTFRVITYRWRDRIWACPTIMRIGSGGNYLDNAHAGGMFIAVDDDGTLHKTAFTEFKKEFTEHPDTHLCFEGYKIELFPRVREAAFRLHESLPQVGCVSWDLTLDEDGNPVMIEANINNGRHGGSIWLPEMAHGCGAFGENTAEILRWLRVMKKVPRSQWHQYEFGKFPE